ncbi:MAG: glycosyltransferase family 2 protein [Candidatus Nanoarchaeia archaeon]|nr:glycosyltransferase family 2 protein [Candidatus Nanoarchaeia archaeon]
MVDLDKVCIILPAYNEGKVIYSVLSEIQKEGFKNILVIDDCSKDNTFSEAKKSGAKVIHHSKNKGAGGATKTGLEYAKNSPFEHFVFMDSDGQHSPKDVVNLLKYALKYDVVIGSRLIKTKGMPLTRKLINMFGSFLTWIFFGLYVRDSQSGFKVFNKKAVSKIKLNYDGFEFCSEIIGEIHKHKLKFKEVPIKVIYTDHSLGKGHGQSVANGLQMVWRFIWRKRN